MENTIKIYKKELKDHVPPRHGFITIHGKKQAGKDTFATYLSDHLRSKCKTVKIVAYADKMKQMISEYLSVPRSLLFGNNEDKETLIEHITWDNMPLHIQEMYGITSGPMSVREICQVTGTDVFRKMFFDSVWIDATLNQSFANYDYVIITDVRLENELRAVETDLKFKIKRNNDIEETIKHETEQGLPDYMFDFIFENNGTIEDIKSYIRRIFI